MSQRSGTPERSRRGLRLRGFHWFSSESHAAVRRRPTDLVLLVSSLLGLLLLTPFAPGPTTVDEAVTMLAQVVPTSLEWVFGAGSVLAAAWALLLLAITVALPDRRVVAVYLLLAAGTAFTVAGLAGAAAGTGWDETTAALLGVGSSPTYPAVRLAVVTAVVVTAAPQVSQPLRRVGRLLLAVAAVSAAVLGVAATIGVLAGFLCGVAAGSAVHLLVGSPGGRPSPRRVADALDDLGLPGALVTDLDPGVTRASRYSAHVPDRPPLLVTVLGRDEWDAQTVAAVWAGLTRRGERPSLGMSRLARVEHTAMAALIAERAGVRVPAVVVAGRAVEGDAVLVTEVLDEETLAGLGPHQVSDGLLDDAWAQLISLHGAHVLHGNVAPQGVVRTADGAAFTDLSAARLGPDSGAVMTDRARMLVVCALAAGPERATASAIRVLGADGVAELLPFVQPAVLDHQTRSAVADQDWSEAELRAVAAGAAGVELPPLEQVRRVTPRSLVRVGLIALVTFGLISAFSGIDLAAVWDQIASADWGLLAIALLVAPLAQAFFAVGTMGATTVPLRYVPVLMLQYAVQFIALALPATAARVALDVRFFRSFGIAAGASVSVGVVDSVSGFVVQVVLLLVIVLSGLPGFEQPVGSGGANGADSGDGSDPSLLALTVAIGLGSLLVVLVVPGLRRRFADRLRETRTALLEQVRSARGALEVLRHPGKVGQLIAGNLGGQLVQAVVLGICLAAFGEDASLSQLILINTAVSLFAGFMPVPGGVGVAEAGITAGLQAIGIPAPVALSTAVTFRLVTFYLPPLWGSAAMRWLRRNSYV